MNSYPDVAEVLQQLGDKFLRTFSGSVTSTKRDLADFREWRPGWFPGMHGRTLANVIHDRLWANFSAGLGNDVWATLIEHGATREIQVGTNFLLRVKRHHEDDSISSYPTLSDRIFWGDAQAQFDGFELIRLACGYRWDSEAKQMLAPLISYRDGKDNPIWSVELDEPDDGTQDITWRPVPTPDLPALDLGRFAADDEGSEEES